MKKLYIVGCGGFGREVLWLAERINDAETARGNDKIWEIAGFIDDNSSIHGTRQDGYLVLGGCEELKACKEEVYAVIAIGSAKIKRAVAEKLADCKQIHFATLIDPSVIRSDRVQIGAGSILCAGTILTVGVTIGRHVILNLDCTLGHDAVLKDYVTVYPSANLSGNVWVGEGAELGTGMQVIQGKRIGAASIVGAGAVVVKDLPPRCTAVGNPARVIKFLNESRYDEDINISQS